MAGRLPLVRVEGKPFTIAGAPQMTHERFATVSPLLREARDSIARQAEAEYGFEASLYFYGGIAHPAFGDIVLAYHPEASEVMQGSSNTFDTGGLYAGHISGRALSEPADRRALVHEDVCTLSQWRDRLDRWIESYFESIDAYVEGRPSREDPSGRTMNPRNERRAWAFEIRLYQDVALLDDLAFTVVRQDFWVSVLEAARAYPDKHAALLDLFADGRVFAIDAASAQSVCARGSEVIKRYTATHGEKLI